MTGWAVNSIVFAIKGSIPFLPNYVDPNAGIGRQNELKLRWYNIIKVQVLFWIHEKYINRVNYRSSLQFLYFSSVHLLYSLI
jgi:hypothetical protein